MRTLAADRLASGPFDEPELNLGLLARHTGNLSRPSVAQCGRQQQAATGRLLAGSREVCVGGGGGGGDSFARRPSNLGGEL